MGYTKTGDPFVCGCVFCSPFILVDRPYSHVRLLRSAQYYLSPKKLMRMNMKDIIFQLDIQDMGCLELLDGMSLFSLLSSLYFPLLCYRFVLVFFFFLPNFFYEVQK